MGYSWDEFSNTTVQSRPHDKPTEPGSTSMFLFGSSDAHMFDSEHHAIEHVSLLIDQTQLSRMMQCRSRARITLSILSLGVLVTWRAFSLLVGSSAFITDIPIGKTSSLACTSHLRRVPEQDAGLNQMKVIPLSTFITL